MSVTSAQTIIDYFKRNNPVEAALLPLLQWVYFLCTLSSRRKLNKFKYLLAIEKLEKMQTSLTEGYKPQTAYGKMNKIY